MLPNTAVVVVAMVPLPTTATSLVSCTPMVLAMFAVNVACGAVVLRLKASASLAA